MAKKKLKPDEEDGISAEEITRNNRFFNGLVRQFKRLPPMDQAGAVKILRNIQTHEQNIENVNRLFMIGHRVRQLWLMEKRAKDFQKRIDDDLKIIENVPD